jgi:hypothetical protein
MAPTDFGAVVFPQRSYFLEGNTRSVALWHDVRRDETDAALMDIEIQVRV